jgi:heme-degrading monooxygenase HmoA
MILEVATLNVKPGKEKLFEETFGEAQMIISSMDGYISHQLHKSIENNSRYILLVNWQSLEDHTVGFRQSEKYQEWSELLHQFYDPFPVVEHYTSLYANGL